MKNEKGFTIIELVVAFAIFSIMFIASMNFFTTFKDKSAQLGEYESAKSLVINGIENERKSILSGDENTGNVYIHQTRINGIKFTNTVEKEDVTNDFYLYSQKVKMYKVTSTVKWRLKHLEVATYVSAR